MARISTPILGWDFLHKYQLSVGFQGPKRCKIQLGGVSVRLFLGKASQDILGFCQIGAIWDDQHQPVNFKKYSNAQKVNNLPIIPQEYKTLPEFLGMGTPNFMHHPPHNIILHINTGDSALCQAKVCLLPESPKEVQRRENWM